MTNIETLILEGYELHLKVEALKEKLKKIETLLKSEALRRPHEHLPLKSKHSDGTQWIASTEQCEARIIIPADRLKETFPWESRETEKVRAICGEHFETLFEPVWHFVPTHHFRRKAAELLAENARRLLKACTKSTTPKILWKEKETL